MTYNEFYKKSIENPEEFWKEQAQELTWYKFPETILGKNKHGYPRWFEDGILNMCYLALDKHIEDGFGDNTAVIYDSPVTQNVRYYTYHEVKTEDSIEHFQLEHEVIQLVRKQIGAVASLKNVVIVKRLPKTRSGKILRKLLRAIVDKEDFQIPSTIDDEAIISEIQTTLKEYFNK